MISRIFIFASAAIVLYLGCVHLAYTFFTHKFSPREAQLEIAMKQVAPRISSETTVWKASMGFHVSHSMGAILFGFMRFTTRGAAPRVQRCFLERKYDRNAAAIFRIRQVGEPRNYAFVGADDESARPGPGADRSYRRHAAAMVRTRAFSAAVGGGLTPVVSAGDRETIARCARRLDTPDRNHRGQIAALVRQHGGEPAYTDFIQAVRTDAVK
jgi:hypothetical protein